MSQLQKGISAPSVVVHPLCTPSQKARGSIAPLDPPVPAPLRTISDASVVERATGTLAPLVY